MRKEMIPPPPVQRSLNVASVNYQ